MTDDGRQVMGKAHLALREIEDLNDLKNEFDINTFFDLQQILMIYFQA